MFFNLRNFSKKTTHNRIIIFLKIFAVVAEDVQEFFNHFLIIHSFFLKKIN